MVTKFRKIEAWEAAERNSEINTVLIKGFVKST
jgi:hypothetical protein